MSEVNIDKKIQLKLGHCYSHCHSPNHIAKFTSFFPAFSFVWNRNLVLEERGSIGARQETRVRYVGHINEEEPVKKAMEMVPS